jgi:hypothetical protein
LARPLINRPRALPNEESQARTALTGDGTADEAGVGSLVWGDSDGAPVSLGTALEDGLADEPSEAGEWGVPEGAASVVEANGDRSDASVR